MSVAEISFWHGEQELDLASDATAIVEFELPAGNHGSIQPGMQISGWWLDLEKGAWRRGGLGTVGIDTATERLVWSLSVDHFTWYGMGELISADFECFVVKATDQWGAPVLNQGFRMKTLLEGGAGAFYDGGYTDLVSENLLTNCVNGPISQPHSLNFSGAVDLIHNVPAGKGGLGTCDEGGANPSCAVIELELPPSTPPVICTPSSYKHCKYPGPAETEGIGACSSGYDYCVAGGTAWSGCTGTVTPTTESCKGALDDDCDGSGNDPGASQCGCIAGNTADCYSGPAATLNVGECRMGKRVCNVNTQKYSNWCYDEIVPVVEKCDTPADEDCDGLAGCTPPAQASPYVYGSPAKQVHVNWPRVVGAKTYQVFESMDPSMPFFAVSPLQASHALSLEVALHLHESARYVVRSCNNYGCADSSEVVAASALTGSIGYFKAINSDAMDGFGGAVATSAAGDIVAIGAYQESSGVSEGGEDFMDDDAPAAGAVYVYKKVGDEWIFETFLKAPNADAGDGFGWSVAMSGDGNVLAVGALREASANEQTDNSRPSAGAVYIYRKVDQSWIFDAYLKAANPGAGDWFGMNVAIDALGETVAVSAYREDSSATGINGDQGNDSATDSGAVYVFRNVGGVWEQDAYLKASNTGAFDYFGWSLSLSDDGKSIAVGAYGEDSAAMGVNGSQLSNAASFAGAAYVFVHDLTWQQTAYVKASNTGVTDFFGTSVALDGDGDLLVVGAYGEDSASQGVGGDGQNNNAINSGAIYVFRRVQGNVWSHESYVKPFDSGPGDVFGYRALAVDDSGSLIFASSIYEDGGQTGVGGVLVDENAPDAGSVYVFLHTKNGWTQRSYVKASNTGAGDQFGSAIAIDADGGSLFVGAPREASNATGVNGIQADDSIPQAGAVYAY